MKVTFTLPALPGAISGLFFPVILKSCETLPLLASLKVTAPFGTDDFERANLNSVMDTRTDVAAFACDHASTPEPVSASAPASAASPLFIASPRLQILTGR